MKILDVAALLAGLLVVSAVSYAAYGRQRQGADLVSVRTSEGQWLFPLSEDRKFLAEGPDGSCQLVIAGRSAWVQQSDCPQNICVRTGKISQQGQWIACLPHQVFVSIEGGQEQALDAISS